jgi:glucosamine-6-phosphate deaminase
VFVRIISEKPLVMEVVIQPNADAAAEFAAWLIGENLRTKLLPVLGLATGRTMEAVYAKLVALHLDGNIDFSTCQTFNLDEYVGLAATDRNSYRHYMNRHLFSKVNINLRSTHLPDGMAGDLEAECGRYDQLIASAAGIDLQLLGIGSNGHLGFNEPLSSFKSRTRVVTLTPETIEQNSGLFGSPEQMPRQAITMGVETILDARRCVLLATGSDKAAILAKAIEGPMTSMIPATALQMHRDCVVIADEAAAGKLAKAEYYRAVFENHPQWKKFQQSCDSGNGKSRLAYPTARR